MPVERKPFSWPLPYFAWVANMKALNRPKVCVDLSRIFESHGIDVLMVGKIQQSRYQWLRQPDLLPANMHYLVQRTLEQVNGILAGVRALVHSSIQEGLSRNFIQAWLQCKPTISLGFDPGRLITRREFGYVANGNKGNFYHDIIRVVEDRG